ncbi:MAG: hypothetical protein ACTSPV_17060 [Candidatus Hodarchaeales archaeon]
MPWTAKNDNVYKYCLLDTNIISEIVKNPLAEGKVFLEKFPADTYIPCISAYSLVELRKNQSVFSAFMDQFSEVLFFVTKPFTEILAEEFKTYVVPNEIQPVQLAVIPNYPQVNLERLIEEIFSDEEVIETENHWQENNLSVLSSWTGRLENYQQESPTANSKDADRYWEEAGLQTLMFLNPAWAKEKVEEGHLIDANHFSSVKAMLYSQYYRLYDPHWEPRPQEVTDIQIIAVSPYVDAVITEKFQAEILKKIKTKIYGMENLEIATLRNLR